LERDKWLLKRLVKSWDAEKKDEATGDPKALADFARRVRLAKMSLNVLGRSVTGEHECIAFCTFDIFQYIVVFS